MSRLSRADRLKFASQPVAQSAPSLISPINGWNARDALDAMDPADAIQLDNWFPDAGGVIVRNGFTQFAALQTSPPLPVQTLAEYNVGPGAPRMLAAQGTTVTVIVNGAIVTSFGGFVSATWQTCNFLSRVFFCNGVDATQVYDGTTLATSTFTGVDLTSLVGVIQYQQRLFFWQNNSTGFWFAPLNAITGGLQFFDLSAFTPRGGNLIAATTFSHDGGNGVLDFIAFMMSSGDCVIYYGNDPANINNFQLIGRYRISPPVNIRAVCNYGAEAFMTTFDDHVPLQQQLVALKAGAIPPRSKVSSAVQAAANANFFAFGWQALFYPAGRRLIFNIPNTDGSFSQHVQNTEITYTDSVTGVTASPWCRFNMPAQCFGLYQNALFFGAADGNIYKADTGNLDNRAPIVATGQQSWNTLGNPSRKKITAYRCVVQARNPFTSTLQYDYNMLNVLTTTAATSTVNSAWDISPWNTSPWSTGVSINQSWHVAGGSGVAVSVAVDVTTGVGPSTWFRTDFKIEQGAML